ncbi:class I SAM-dependent methyltransferase [Ideonella livida]|uniref:Class I SAM-dependent methyltransferase n=1 Tax=Ideonella livida TaxID=2707176 RepID=A0A7C9TIN6_9BURK|nr:class I SAM-dependent methyltransferase [Ideonella livida]NDY89965.1 class I SAM-dependent methyltransferase [Ideonella livida]
MDLVNKPGRAATGTFAESEEAAWQSLLGHWWVILQGFAQAGGPQPAQYRLLQDTLGQLHQARLTGRLSSQELDGLRRSLGEAMGEHTLQGRAWLKPQGPGGDYRLMDDLYLQRISALPQLAAWDRFLLDQPCVRALQQRKAHFKQTVHELCVSGGHRPLKVLNVGCGPCREVFEYLEEQAGTPVQFVCVDQNPHALAHARQLCRPHAGRVQFMLANALRMRLHERFDLVWCAGLAETLDDRGLAALLARLVDLAEPRAGQVVLGNTASGHPSQAYLAFCDWSMQLRTPEQLRDLARVCGIPFHATAVETDPTGVHHWLRLAVGL